MTKEVYFDKVIDFLEGPGVRNWQFQPTGIKLVNIRNLVEDSLILDNTVNHLSFEEVEQKYSHFLLQKGDFVMASSGVTWGKIAEVKEEHLPLCLNTSIIKLRTKNNLVEKRYLWFFIKSHKFKSQIDKLITGSAQPNFGPSHLKKVTIPLPPIATQQRIASILDEADALRKKTQQLIDSYDQLAQSIFLDMFGDTRYNPKKWEVCDLEEICSSIVDCPHSTPKYVDEITDYPCIRTTELKNGNIDWSSMKYLDLHGHKERTKRIIPKEGDIIYGREGTFGEAIIIPPSVNISLGQRVMLFRPKYKIISSTFLHSVIRSPGLYYQALRVNTGSTVGHVNVADIKKFKIILPPITLQNQFAEKIALIEQQKELAKKSLKESEDLFQSLLQKAFKGELV